MSNQDLFIKQILKEAKSIAILGLSPDESKPSNKVARYLLEQGYRVIPIYPKGGEILGIPTYRTLQEAFSVESQKSGEGGGIDILNIFRKSEAIFGIAKEILELESKPKCVWVQLGLSSPQSREILEGEGMVYFENLCIKLEHQRLVK